MCIKQSRRGYCFVIAIFAYLVGFIEIIYAVIMLVHFNDNHEWLWALVAAWIVMLIAGIFLVVGTCLSHAHIRSKLYLLKAWIAVAMGVGLAIVIIKIWIIVGPSPGVGIWRNILRIIVFCCFLLLLFSFMYFPCLYVQDLNEEFDF